MLSFQKNARQIAMEKKERAVQAAADLKAKADAEQIARKAAEEAAAKVRPSRVSCGRLLAEFGCDLCTHALQSVHILFVDQSLLVAGEIGGCSGGGQGGV